ncbi:MAG: 1-acyl-sn-glycerol-3-phosphate acyltransferase [Bacteroidetes bacterium]|nr:1-acyl-sn-glycerol-3-phosphate acyltransferase [Bacteroidota bacterium]
MLYNFLNFILGIAVRVYFKSITVKKTSDIPGEGPMIIVANHPSTFLDPIVIGLQMKQKLCFLAKAEVFKSGFAKWLLPKFNMIPVYRKQDDANLMHKNEETFDKCYEHLAKKGTIMIFPEGVSLTQRKLEKIKTGAARIALGAEAANHYLLGVKILTVGLNYSNPHRFQSHLFISMDTPINVSDFAEKYKQDLFKATHELTDLIRQRLEQHIISIDDANTDKLVKRIETIYKAKLLQEIADLDLKSRPEKEKDFEMTKRIIDVVNYFKEKQPLRVQRISAMADDYFISLDRLHLKDHLLNNFSKSGSVFFRTLFTLVYLILGFPFWLFGVINNYLPYKIPYYITIAFTKKKDWHGAMFVASGVFTFIIFYSLQLYFVQHFFHNAWITLSYFAFLPISGFFAYKYYRNFSNLRGKWLVFNLFMKRATLISQLITMRQNIVNEFEKGKQEFNAL